MTREEAITVLNMVEAHGSLVIKAKEMAIEALKQPEQKKGKWKITDAYPHNIYCSKCFVRYAQTHWAVWEDGSLPRSYCPNCGAKMEVKQ